jgi:hypothetical protein
MAATAELGYGLAGTGVKPKMTFGLALFAGKKD